MGKIINVRYSLACEYDIIFRMAELFYKLFR